MRLDRRTFYAYVRRAPFGGRLSTEQVEGMNCLLSEWETGDYGDDPRHLANVLAQVFHETGGRMVPVREGFATTDAGARKIVRARKYGVPDPKTGHVYYGRGPIQITWAENYKKLGKALGLPLYEKPDLTLDPRTGARIAFLGMSKGMFTGKRLSQFFNASADDPKGARKIVNGTDKASLIATYHEQFLGAVKKADKATPMPSDVTTEDAKPDDIKPAESKSLWSMFLSFLGAGGTALVTAVNNPWAAGTIVCLVIIGGIGAWLVLSGRIEIKRGHAI